MAAGAGVEAVDVAEARVVHLARVLVAALGPPGEQRGGRGVVVDVGEAQRRGGVLAGGAAAAMALSTSAPDARPWWQVMQVASAPSPVDLGAGGEGDRGERLGGRRRGRSRSGRRTRVGAACVDHAGDGAVAAQVVDEPLRAVAACAGLRDRALLVPVGEGRGGAIGVRRAQPGLVKGDFRGGNRLEAAPSGAVARATVGDRSGRHDDDRVARGCLGVLTGDENGRLAQGHAADQSHVVHGGHGCRGRREPVRPVRSVGRHRDDLDRSPEDDRVPSLCRYPRGLVLLGLGASQREDARHEQVGGQATNRRGRTP